MIKYKSRTNRREAGPIGQHTQVPAVNDPQPFYLRVSSAAYRSGLSRTRLFNLIAEGKIKSKYVTKEGAKRGFRLIETASLLAYINSFGS